jgi:hypothetical protein
MNDVFQKRVKAAAVAGWWTLLIAAIFLTIQWLAYLRIAYQFRTYGEVRWLETLWGPNFDWAQIQNVWFWMTAIFKLCVWVMALIVIWLSLWARGLRKRAQ